MSDAAERKCEAMKRRRVRCKLRAEAVLRQDNESVFSLHSNGIGFDLLAVSERRGKITVVRIDLDERTYPMPKVPTCADKAQVWLFKRENRAPVRIPVK